jgi:membrane protein implicated in regulation of membrane protease activity
MSGWIVWVIVACVFGVGEVTLTSGFWLAPFALGAALAAAIDAAGVSEPLDFLAFLVVTVATLILLRPIVASKLISSTPELRTGAAALVGHDAVVIDRIANDEHVGTVRIGAETWTARSYDERDEIAAGTKVQVVEIRGATALVME